MAAQLCGLSFDLNDVLLADLLREYLRPKEEPLTLQMSQRSLRFLRFALHHPSASAICPAGDPLLQVAHGPAGILAAPTDRAAAASQESRDY